MALIARYTMNGNANCSQGFQGTSNVTQTSGGIAFGLKTDTTGDYDKASQSITTPSDAISLKSIQFRLGKQGSPTGVLTCKVYTGTGTGLVATSTTVNESSLTTSYSYYTFNFNGESISASTQYYFTLESTRVGDGVNYIYGEMSTSNVYTGGAYNRVNSAGTYFPGIYDAVFICDFYSSLNGTASNVTWVDGKENGAGSFNGNTSQITITHNTVLNITNDITLRCWVNLTATPASTYKGFIEKAYATSYFFGIGSNSLGLGFFYGNTQINTGAVLTVGKWHRVGITYNRSSQIAKFFVDGNVVSTHTSFNPTVSGSTNNVLIGRQQAAGYFLNGKLDLFDIMNNTVTEAEIKNDYLLTAGFYGQ